MTFFSIIMPLFNKRDFIETTINSVLAQTNRDFELIVIDDGSSDGSTDLVRGMTDPRIRLVTQENAGAGAARNRGIDEAKSEFIAFLDADDLWIRNHLAIMRTVIDRHPEGNMFSTLARRSSSFSTNGTAALNDSSEIDYFRLLPLLYQWTDLEGFITGTLAIRRDALLEAGRFGRGRMGEDIELWARIALRNRSIFAAVVTMAYRPDPGGLTQTSRRLSDFDPITFSLKTFRPVVRVLAEALEEGVPDSQRPSIEAYIDWRLGIGIKAAIRRKDFRRAAILAEHLFHPGRVLMSEVRRGLRKLSGASAELDDVLQQVRL